MRIISVKSIYKITVLLIVALCAGCTALNPLQNLTNTAQSNLLNDTQTIPQLNLQFALPNDWRTDDLRFSSWGVTQSKLPVPTSNKSSQ